MNETAAPLLRVRNWDQLFENNRSRDMKRTNWFPAPNDLSADGYVDLVSHQEGAAYLGVWNAILMVASRTRMPRRGLLLKEDGRPHSAESLARVTRLPETVVKEAIPRLLEIGLLELVDPDVSETNNVPPHPDAGTPQDAAGKPQEGAVEGKGTEHHHQEGNGKERKGTERADDQRKTEHPGAAAGRPNSSKNGDEEETPGTSYASPEDELKAIYLGKTGEPITIEVLGAIRTDLELNRVSAREFVAEVRKHAANEWRNPAGFLRDLAKRFRAKTRSARDPVTAAEAEGRNYQCPLCHSRVPGQGAVLSEDRTKEVPCICASQEWIAHQRARGLFSEEPAQ